MGAISQIVVRCNQQEDSTGSDDLYFYVDRNFIGSMTITTGETRTVVGPGALFGDTIWIDEGHTLEVYEHDLLDPNDLILSYYVSSSDMDRTVDVKDQCDTADYDFTITFVNI
jgi:hypothetical protein